MTSIWRSTFVAIVAGVLMNAGIPAYAGFSFQGEATGPRATLKRLIEAVEREDSETIRSCIAPRFFDGNPEIPGRLMDSFEKFDNIKIQYKVASVKVADDIVSVKLNWIKTAANPMNNWSYRDVGNDVIMQFSAIEPYQLVGLQEPNLFGVSFLLPTPIIIPSPDEKRIELARQELEIAERKARLQRENDERLRALDAERTAKSLAKNQVRKKEQEEKQAEENLKRKQDEEAAAAKRKADEEAMARKKAAEAAEAARTKQALTSPSSQGLLTADDIAKMAALDRALSETLGPSSSSGSSFPSAEPNAELARQVREKADVQARALLARRKKPEAAAAREDLAIPEILPLQPPPINPDLAEWRESRLKEIRDSQTAIAKMTATPESGKGKIKPEKADTVALDLQDAVRLAAQIKTKSDAEAVRMLAQKRVKDQAKQIEETIPPDITPEDAGAADKEKVQQQLLKRSKEDAEKRAKSVLSEIARLEREGGSNAAAGAQPKPGMSPEEREKARAKAMREAEAEVAAEMAGKKQTAVAKTAGQSKEDQAKDAKAAAEELRRIQDEARISAEVRAKAEEDARRLLVERGKGNLTNKISAVRSQRPALFVSFAHGKGLTNKTSTVHQPETREPSALIAARESEPQTQEVATSTTAGAIPPLARTTQDIAVVSVAPSNAPLPPEVQLIPDREKPVKAVPDVVEPLQTKPLPIVSEQPVKTGLVSAVIGTAPVATKGTQAVAVATTGKMTMRNAPVSASDANPMQTVNGSSQPEGPEYDFLMSRYEITNEEFVQFLNDAKANPYSGRGSNMFFDEAGNVYMDSTTNQNERLFAMTIMDFDGKQSGIVYENGQYRVAPGKERHPVTGVSWYGAVKYCNWLTIRSDYPEEDICYKEGTEPDQWHPITLTDEEWLNGFSDNERQNWIKTCAGFRLPMNNYNTTTGKYNEFYLAAAWSGKENFLYGFGRNTLTVNDANFTSDDGHSFQGALPVGFFDGSVRPGDFKTQTNENASGLFDLSGNAWEWSNDTPGSVEYRSLFGGSWDSGPDALKASFRGSLSPHNTCQNVGFRLVCGIRTHPGRLAPK